MTRPADVTEQPVDARTAEVLASTQIRWYPMEGLCGACGGLGCERCAESDHTRADGVRNGAAVVFKWSRSAARSSCG